ncbi:MAG TPA: 1-acyl-sn-glycerol-3-phosphate acyltransferase [Patescibacteria group bacterium]|nr:1-acyl-sn-glycerol-3-phosphate acyltransferase [Patescibacteria group bacterium]
MSQLTRFPIIKPFVKNLDKDTEKFGLQQAMMNTAVRSGTKLIIEGLNKDTEKVLKNERVVLVANHPHEVDILALFASLPSRPDTSLIISHSFMNLARNIDKHLIPVYVDHHVNDRVSKKIMRKFLKTFHPTPRYSPEVEHERNIESIKEASARVKNGGLITIFPNPGSDITKKWYRGVGHLLKGAKTDDKIYVVKSYIEGTSMMDYLRLIPHAAKLLTPIRITFSEPIEVSSILKKDPKEITSILEHDYKDWINSLKN